MYLADNLCYTQTLGLDGPAVSYGGAILPDLDDLVEIEDVGWICLIAC